MSFNKKFFTTGGIVASSDAACNTDSTDPFGDSSGVALYSLDYDASTAPDGTDYSGSPTNVEFGVGGQINYGARFNGTSSKVVLPVGLGDNGDRTRSMWIKVGELPSSGSDFFFYIGNQGANNDYETLRVNSSGNIQLQERNNAGGSGDLILTSSITLNVGQWYHIAYVFSGTSRELYINNSTTNGATGTKSGGTVDNSSFAGNLGQFRNITPSYDGDIDQVRIFSSALTSDQVEDLYEETACVYDCTTDDVNYPFSDGTNVEAYYKLDNSSEDYVGGNDGSDTNVEYRFGRFGQAAVFNGTDSALDTNYTVSGTGDFSCSLWANIEDDGTRNALISLYTGQGASSTVLYAPLSTASKPDEWYFSSKNTDVFYGPSIKFGQWQHVVLTYTHTNTTFTIYIDGVSIGTSVASSATGRDLIIGALNTSGAVSTKGLIDQVRVYDVALTDSQVTELYEEKQCYITKDAADPFGDSNSVALYEMENNANDTSGNGNNGNQSNVSFTSTDPIRGTYEASFNGTDSKIVVPSILNGFTNTYSFSVWAKIDNTDNFAFFDSDPTINVSTNFLRFTLHQNGNYYFDFGNNSTARLTGTTPSDWRDGNWHHFVFVSTSTQKLVYVDGSLFNNLSSTVAISGKSNLTVGHYLTNYADGEYDQLRIFNRALDGTEAYQLYAEGAKGTGL